MNDFCKILLVDDDALFLQVYSEFLSGKGFFVVSERNAKEALARVASGEHFDAAIVDVMLVGMNGWEFLKELRGKLDKTILQLPVIIISAFRSSEVEFEAFKHLANAMITKDPSTPDKLLEQLNNLVGKRASKWTL
jgi:CheY-like chemotaxis protein